MPLKASDLRAGDRVLLNCPKSRVATHRQALFEGIFNSLDEAMRHERSDGRDAYLAGSATAEFLNSRPWARFLMQTLDDHELIGAFAVEPDGTLKDEEGRRIFIERRIVAGKG